ncbi:Sensor histidine kinase mtrB [Actinosynnema pretiosum subsp. pretiosum]|nr:Sensor histidine kinase mtrB [Actinosynnema pretiosum subsp. pretiosum]
MMRTRLLDPVAREARRVAERARRQAVRFGELWRRSMQLRVVVSTLALSSAVVFVLGMVLQEQIVKQLLDAKTEAATRQADASVAAVQPDLLGLNPGPDSVKARFTTALNKINATGTTQEAATSGAGAFEPVLADSAFAGSDGQLNAVGPWRDVPVSLRELVERGSSGTQISTVERDSGRTTFLVVGMPVASSARSMQLYLLFPLTSEQTTAEFAQNTLIVGGVVLLLLLAAIANLVTRQVVRPVRHAAEVAERFAEGSLDERMPVVGEDDVARLAQSYNEMAASIQRQFHQLEEFGQLQRRFTSDVSHELRTPLTTVRMAADVLHASREQFPAGLARSTELLVDELDRFESLLGDLLEISRLDAGVEELSPELVDVRVLVRRAHDSVRAIANSSGTSVVLDLPEHEVTAEIEARRVERILRNLLANAIDHGEGLPVELTLRGSGDAIAVTVRDHGVGLRSGEADLVFNRFWRADPSRNRRTGGTGLGLSISLEDARLHGGWLQAWGERGHGAVFRLTLPRVHGDGFAESPLPLVPPELADVEPAPDEEEEVVLPVEFTAGEITWQPAQPVDADREVPDELGGVAVDESFERDERAARGDHGRFVGADLVDADLADEEPSDAERTQPVQPLGPDRPERTGLLRRATRLAKRGADRAVDRVGRAERAERPEKPEKPEKPGKPGKGDRAERIERAGRAGRASRVGRVVRGGRTARAAKAGEAGVVPDAGGSALVDRADGADLALDPRADVIGADPAHTDPAHTDPAHTDLARADGFDRVAEPGDDLGARPTARPDGADPRREEDR